MSDLTGLAKAPAEVLAWLMFVTSPAFILFGARYGRVMGSVLAFMFTGYFALLLLIRLDLWEDELSSTAGCVTLLVAAFAVASLAAVCPSLGVFLIGATTLLLVCNFFFQLVVSNVTEDSEMAEIIRWILLTAACAVGGFGIFKMQPSLLRAGTALIGGYCFAGGSAYVGSRFRLWNDNSLCPTGGFFQHPDRFNCTTTECLSLLGVWVLLFMFGWCFQHATGLLRLAATSTSTVSAGAAAADTDEPKSTATIEIDLFPAL